MCDDLQYLGVQGRFTAHEVDVLVAVEEPELVQGLAGLVHRHPRLLPAGDQLVVAELAPHIAREP
jgi:hypothetical protein